MLKKFIITFTCLIELKEKLISEKNKRMKLGVDARMMYGAWQYRGIGKYTKSIISFLPKNNVVAFLPKNQTLDDHRCVSEGNGFFPWWENAILPKLAKREHITHLLCPSITSPLSNITNIKKIVVIYDLIFMQAFRDLPPSHSIYNNLGRLYRRYSVPKAYSSADLLISISEYSRSELNERFNIPKEKIHVIPCSISNDWFVSQPVNKSENTPYLLAVSGDAPSKNLPGLLKAFSIAVKDTNLKDFKLRIVGVNSSSKKYFLKIIKGLGIENQVILEDFVSKEQLQKLYREAWASLTLSLYEGFGIPIIEAMASGTPVVCSNTTSLPEVAGNAAIFANPRDIQSMVSAILKVITISSEDYLKMSIAGISQANLFNETIVAQKIKSYWSKVLF